MPKKKFKDTRVGKFLVKTAPDIFGVASNLLPDAGVLGMVKQLISKDSKLPTNDKGEALRLIDLENVEAQEVSKRWTADMASDSFLSKNTRPMTLIFLTVSMIFLIVLDSLDIDFGVNAEWIELLKSLLITVYVAYFGSRGVEKYKYISAKQ